MTKTYENPRLAELTAHYNANGWQHCDRGTKAALRAYCQAEEYGLDALAVQEMPFPGDMPAFKDCLAQAGVTEFLLCDQSTGLMESLHDLMAEGWYICGAFERNEKFSPLLGLRMRKALRLHRVGAIEDYFRTYYEAEGTGEVYALMEYRGVRTWNTAICNGGEPDMPLPGGLRIEIVEDGRVISREIISRVSDCSSIGLSLGEGAGQ